LFKEISILIIKKKFFFFLFKTAKHFKKLSFRSEETLTIYF